MTKQNEHTTTTISEQCKIQQLTQKHKLKTDNDIQKHKRIRHTQNNNTKHMRTQTHT